MEEYHGLTEQASGLAAIGAARKVFGSAYENLNVREKEVIAADLIRLAEEEGRNIDEAAQSLRSQIGGPQALPQYVQTIMRNPEITALADRIFR